MKKIFPILSLTLFFNLSCALAGEVYVYHHVENKEAMDLGKLREIFNAGKLSWNNGKHIMVLVNEMNQIADKSFKDFAEVSKTQFMNEWRAKFFSGRARVPIQIKKEELALASLENNPASIFFSFSPLNERTLQHNQKIIGHKIQF